MTNIVTAVLILLTNSSQPRHLGAHQGGAVLERQHQVVETWQLLVNGKPITNRVITNWFTLDVIPTNPPPSTPVELKTRVIDTNNIPMRPQRALRGRTNQPAK